MVATLLAISVLLSSCGRNKEWSTFTSEAGGFSISMPGLPEEESQLTATEYGTTEAHTFIAEDAGFGYSAIYADYPNNLIQAYPADVILGGISFGVISQSAGELLSSAEITFNDYPGKALDIASPVGDSVLMVRLYLVGNRIYQLSVVSVSARINDENVNRFFDSFRLFD